MIIIPYPEQGPSTISIGWDTEREVKWEDCQGGGGRVGGGKVKGQLSLRAVVTSVVRQRMGKAVQTGSALPLGRCASPPPPPPPLPTRSHTKGLVINYWEEATKQEGGK